MEKLRIIFEDKDVLVINKPSGLVVEQEKSVKGQETLEDILKNDYKIDLPRGGIVHRLDRDTSGLMVVAKTEKALISLQNQFQSHQVEKQYLALVLGEMEAKEGTIDIALKRDPKNGTRFVATRAKEGREAVTHYTLKSQIPNPKSQTNPKSKIQNKKNKNSMSLVEVNLETGRTHQIRVHFFAIGHPVIGDQVYRTPLSESVSEKLGLKRQFLHAIKLSFTHPTTGKKVSFESEPPEDLDKITKKQKN